MGHSEVTMETLISQEYRGWIWNEISKRIATSYLDRYATRYLCQSQDYYTTGTNNISEMINR